MHCHQILNAMTENYQNATIRQTYITMGVMFKAAKENRLIMVHPLDGVKFNKPVRAASDIRFLTVQEQQRFLETAKRSHNYRQYRLLLETGLRTSELIGLTWDSIDWEKHTLTISKTLEYRHSAGVWRAGTTKSMAGYRTIFLTDTAYSLLRECYDERKSRKMNLDRLEVLDYPDRKTGTIKRLDMKDLVFINYRTGEPSKNSSYDTHLYKLCDEAGIKRFCMHTLRHTYATRAIESGMSPKVLQKLLGHSTLAMTMDRYVHVTDDAMERAVKLFEAANFGVSA